MEGGGQRGGIEDRERRTGERRGQQRVGLVRCTRLTFILYPLPLPSTSLYKCLTNARRDL